MVHPLSVTVVSLSGPSRARVTPRAGPRAEDSTGGSTPAIGGGVRERPSRRSLSCAGTCRVPLEVRAAPEALLKAPLARHVFRPGPETRPPGQSGTREVPAPDRVTSRVTTTPDETRSTSSRPGCHATVPSTVGARPPTAVVIRAVTQRRDPGARRSAGPARGGLGGQAVGEGLPVDRLPAAPLPSSAGDAVRASISRSPSTTMYGTFCSWAVRILYCIRFDESSTSTRSPRAAEHTGQLARPPRGAGRRSG